MKRYIVPMLLAALAACSEPPPPQPADGSPQGPVETKTVLLPGDTEADLRVAPTPDAREVVYDKPQLVYYRINEH